MNNSLQIFTNNGRYTRTIQDDNGEIWFVAKDVCEALDYARFDSNLLQNVPAVWADTKRIRVRSENGVEQEREMLCLSEQGLYFFLGRSDKPKALPYQMWVAGEVVPSIRKHGAYMTSAAIDNMIDNPDFGIRLLQALKEERVKNEFLVSEAKALQQKINDDKPKVVFADSVSASNDSILIRDLAKLLRQNGYYTGEKRLFQELRDKGYLMKHGSSYNMPTQKSMELGVMEIVEHTINRGDGDTIIRTTTRITGKGQVYFINLFLKHR